LRRELFRPRSGPDRRYFTPLQGSLVQIPFKGYITTNYNPGLLEARNRLRSDIASTGLGTWRVTDIVIRWQNDEIFREHPCPLLSRMVTTS